MTTNYTPHFGLALPDFRQGPWHDSVNSDFSKIDAFLYSALAGGGTVPWANNTVFAAGISAVDSDASIWLCLVGHTSPGGSVTFAQDRVANPGRWAQLIAGFAPRGEWAHNTNYYPYDLAYQTSLGTFALCKTRHVSNSAGTMKDDSVNWSFIYDLSLLNLATASAVTYSGVASGLTATNVQTAIDQVEAQAKSLDAVNVAQGTAISNLQTKDTTHETRMTTIEGVNTTQDGRLTAIEAKNAAQDTKDTSLQNQINALPTTGLPITGGTMTGLIGSANSGVIQTAGPVASFMAQGPSHGCMSFLVQAVFGANFGMASDGNFYMGGWSHGNVAYKFWTTRDFSSAPVTGTRLVQAGDWSPNVSGANGVMSEPFGGGVISGVKPVQSFDGITLTIYHDYRWRYIQIFVGGNWATVGYAN